MRVRRPTRQSGTSSRERWNPSTASRGPGAKPPGGGAGWAPAPPGGSWGPRAWAPPRRGPEGPADPLKTPQEAAPPAEPEAIERAAVDRHALTADRQDDLLVVH